MTSQKEKELQQLNHELRNACLSIEALLKRMAKACKEFEKELVDNGNDMA